MCGSGRQEIEVSLMRFFRSIRVQNIQSGLLAIFCLDVVCGTNHAYVCRRVGLEISDVHVYIYFGCYFNKILQKMVSFPSLRVYDNHALQKLWEVMRSS